MAESKRARFRLTRKRKRALAWVGVLVAFTVVLTAWSAGPTDSGHHANVTLPTASGTVPVASAAAPTLLPATRPSSTETATGGAPGGLRTLVPNLPGSSRDINPADLPARTVVITVTSDRPILRMGYRVLYGHPDSGSAINVASPMRITTVGRGYGLVAAIGAQATPIATYITCTVTVDGNLHSQHTVHGGYSVVACLG